MKKYSSSLDTLYEIFYNKTTKTWYRDEWMKSRLLFREFDFSWEMFNINISENDELLAP